MLGRLAWSPPLSIENKETHGKHIGKTENDIRKTPK